VYFRDAGKFASLVLALDLGFLRLDVAVLRLPFVRSRLLVFVPIFVVMALGFSSLRLPFLHVFLFLFIFKFIRARAVDLTRPPSLPRGRADAEFVVCTATRSLGRGHTSLCGLTRLFVCFFAEAGRTNIDFRGYVYSNCTAAPPPSKQKRLKLCGTVSNSIVFTFGMLSDPV
jgi:hypothetical protein